MKAYELLFFVDPSIDEETRLATSKRIDTAITEQGGKVSNVEDWGKRKLGRTRSTVLPKAITLSSISRLIPLQLQSSTACSTSWTLSSVT